MSDSLPPHHRTLLELVAAGPNLDLLARALEVLDRHPTADAIVALRTEVKEDVKRLRSLLDLLVEAELGHIQRAGNVR